MGLKKFEIVFDNPWKVYYPGQTLSGNIVLVLDGGKKIRGICVKVTGTANTEWKSSDDTTLGANEVYFRTKYYLVGSASGPEIEIQTGEHKFPFSCALLDNLPSSFESEYGYVRYTLKATLDRPWKFDHEVKEAFTVVSPLDLNQEPKASEPIRVEASKSFCCLCCTTGPLTVTYSSPVRGYVPGQSMPIKINVENLSNVTVDRIGLTLCKVVTFRSDTSTTDTKTEEIVVTEISKGPVEAGAVLDYEQYLEVPALPPSNLTNCNIIDLEYCLKVEAFVSGWHHRNLRSTTPVFVGTVPLVNYQTPSAPPESMLADSPTKPPIGFQPSLISNLYPELQPPSYEESTYGAKTLRDPDESEYVIGLTNSFAPRYPVYYFTGVQ